MKQCPVCKREMKEHLLYCPFDGNALVQVVERDALVGAVLDNKYRIDEKVGEGGMGRVYRATHIQMDHTVAVKVLHPHLSSDQTAIERFRREARAAAYISHPNAVSVTDFGVTRDTGTAYLVMEFLEGIELRKKLKQQRHLNYQEAFLIVYQTCAALHAAHSKGIVHRDLKPDNIWLIKSQDGFDRVKVLDFGIAKLMVQSDTGKLTQQGMIVGTPFYMSPEQCRGEEL
ncbi:MAG TPA: serine/threonine-protein kinase, partial [Blastocatellia bacterium]